MKITSSRNLILVKQNENWADEMDLEGFFITTQEDFNGHLSEAKKAIPFTICIGTNEEVEYTRFADYANSFKVESITEDEYQTLKKLFGTEINGLSFGNIVFKDLEE